ncbi:hypothetical protein [Candidatus Symbiopectobacterium sp. 'North America']|uniref:hypothetical protein n=1 Tax=Candidatus Symbiopectobacterium sp. 'North America' TaxID=2794574 RepID=UPI001FD5D595|nr:hypothetical protein [Candidatus Symbiopectobacterium sp. 'North America']
MRANTSRLGLLLSLGVMEILGLPAHQLTPLLRAVITPVVVVVATIFFDWSVALCAAFGCCKMSLRRCQPIA